MRLCFILVSSSFRVNDRIITVNGVSLENVEYATAVQVLRDSGNTVKLVVKRRVALPPAVINHQHTHSLSSIGQQMMNNPPGTISISPTTSNNNVVPGQPIKVTLSKTNKKEDFGIVLGCRLFVKVSLYYFLSSLYGGNFDNCVCNNCNISIGIINLCIEGIKDVLLLFC